MKEMIEYGNQILRQLNDSGFEAYFVGGFVRDELLSIESSDIDIATNALPSQVESIFDKTAATGKKYGTITVLIENYAYEVTTYRIDREYKNFRQPESVNFSKNLKDDLIRRDFTMNALARDINGCLVDMFKGKEDIKDRIIRAIDDPNKRFKEDALRILRAIRFVGKLNFTIDKMTLKAMKDHKDLLYKLPSERLIKELALILKQKHIQEVYKLLNELKLADTFSSLSNAIGLLENSSTRLNLQQFFALGLYPDKQLNTDKWRFSNKQASNIETIKHLMTLLQEQRLTSIIVYNYEKNLLLAANDLLVNFYHGVNQRDKIINLDRHLIIRSFKDLKISGNDILPFVKDKKDVGHIIERLIEGVLLKKIDNSKEDLLLHTQKFAEDFNENK